MNIDHLLATGEHFPAPLSAERWFPIADQRGFVRAALADPIAFWRERAATIAWDREPSQTFAGTIDDQHWFADGRLNATVSCLDRHVRTHPDAIAYDFLCENGVQDSVTYRELLARVNVFANALAADGVREGDRVCIYMPLTIEGIVAMLACARLGAIHSVVYAGLGASALRDRIEDAGAKVVIAADVTYRRGAAVSLRTIVEDAVRPLADVRRVIVWRRGDAPATDPREVDWDAFSAGHSEHREPAIVAAEHPLFILYTSGTTGKPKGVVMTHGGYLTGVTTMMDVSLAITPEDAYWCTSDIGWIVGHSLIVYGALANRLHSLLREGSADYPSTAAVYEVIERYRITKLYTAPTLARMLMRLGPDLARKHDLSSLEGIWCAGEPLNPEAWHFLYLTIGKENVAVCNQWWQTELAAPAIGFFPRETIEPDHSGYALGPLAFSIRNPAGERVPPGEGGLLVLETPSPYMFAKIWGDDARKAEYFNQVPGVYCAGDVATIDAGGEITVLGRADDVINVAAHRIATSDVESALVSHPACGEAGVVGIPDEIKGTAILAYVVLRAGYTASEELTKALIAHVRYELGPIATPGRIEIVAKLPKTRSGKIMRRLLRAQATGAALGDTTTLEE
ncbi:MAG: acetate--CoA ligase [Candidatus Velthaea sp.]